MPSSSPSSETQTIRILCFGDSLTSGTPESHPYAGKLKERLEELLNNSSSSPTTRSTGGTKGSKGREKEKKIVLECEVAGLPGDWVTGGQYMKRLEKEWEHNVYDWTIILGGTNDFAWDVSTDTLIAGLKKVWDIPLSRGGKVLALTIPDTKLRGPEIPERRAKVNQAIKAYKKTNFFHFDLAAAIPHHTATPAERAAHWWHDGVHMSAGGYDLFGTRVAESLAPIIRLAEAQDTDISDIVTDARQRRAIEDLIVEEERGDPRLLSQGYIVVRRRDLD
ncbi:SGNH hydrolase [Camillea tinctor]|nr:SGNH hydrolase [Camillea tinctor]